LRASLGTLAAVAFGLLTCARLPELEPNVCGNAVIEDAEDCDSFAEPGATCLPPGSIGECHFDCSPASGGLGGCPAGWGCDLGGICRPPTDQFEDPREFEVGTVDSLVAADFDGDGRTDLLSAEVPDDDARTHIKFHYFDERGALDETRSFPFLVYPTVATISPDDIADVVFSDGRIGLLRGRADRSWVPETFSSYRIASSAIRTLTVREGVVDDTSGFVIFTALEGIPGVYVPDSSNEGIPRRLGALGDAIENLVGDPVAAPLYEGSPCWQAITAVRGASHFSVLDLCVLGPDSNPRWMPEMSVRDVGLDPPEPIVTPPQAADIDGDGHLDVIVGSSERAFVAFGDGVTLADSALPLALPLRGSDPSADAGVADAGLAAGATLPLPMPLAARDVTGDGAIDFVFPDGILLSNSPFVAGDYEFFVSPGGSPGLTVAAIADFNANLHLDVVAGSNQRPGLTFFNGTGSANLTFFSVPTSRPVQRIAVGDFDGDLIEDVAFTQESGGEPAETQVLISFGAAFRPPEPSVAVARLANVEQLGTYRQFALSHLLIASSEGAGAERRGVLTLLTGNGDRMPVALYDLTTFAEDSSVLESAAVRVLTGAFASPTPADVLALAFAGEPEAEAPRGPLEFWLLSALGVGPSTPTRLDGALPADAHPLSLDGASVTLTATSADVNGDGFDEAIVGVPFADDDHCALFLFDVEPDRVVMTGELALDEPCAIGQIATFELDGDDSIDIAWLTARQDGTDRRLSIFWNDGTGQFSSDRRSIVSDRAASPRTFAILPANAARPNSLAFATPLALELVAIDPATRALAQQTPRPLSGCTGLAAADLNGDGAVDVAAAVRGNLQVFTARLEDL
jgi:hypothetical protein